MVTVVDEARANFGDKGSFTWMHGGEIGRMKLAIEAAGDVERLRFIGDIDGEFGAETSTRSAAGRRFTVDDDFRRDGRVLFATTTVI